MRESTTCQAILEEGRVEGTRKGRIEEARRLLLLLGSQRLGNPSAGTLAALDRVTQPEQIESLAVRLLDVESWDDLWATGFRP